MSVNLFVVLLFGVWGVVVGVPQQGLSPVQAARLSFPTANQRYPNSEKLTGWDRFSYGFLSLTDGLNGWTRKVDDGVDTAFQLIQGALNFIHILVHNHNPGGIHREYVPPPFPPRSPPPPTLRRRSIADRKREMYESY